MRADPVIREAEEAQKLKFIHFDVGPISSVGMPRTRRNKAKWHLYAELVKQYPADFILVDGRFRVATMLTGLLYGKPGCVVALHDFGGTKYRRHRVYLELMQYCDIQRKEDTMAVMSLKSDVTREEVDAAISHYSTDWR